MPLAILFAPFIWISTKIAAFFSAAFAFLALSASKKLALSFIYIGLFVGLVLSMLAAINMIISPLLSPLSALGGSLFIGLSYVIPPVFDVAVSAIISARVSVWLYLQHYAMIKLVSES